MMMMIIGGVCTSFEDAVDRWQKKKKSGLVMRDKKRFEGGAFEERQRT